MINIKEADARERATIMAVQSFSGFRRDERKRAGRDAVQRQLLTFDT
jgi:hypothetical protein